MLIQELLNSKVDYEVTKQNASTFKTLAQIGDRWITFIATKEDEDVWDLAFYESENWNAPLTSAKTGSGDELKVFSMVMASIKEFLDRYSPNTVIFTADKDDGSETRAKLYGRIASKYLKGFTGEKFDHGKTTHFTYTKDEQ
jgi:hypothetical protein